MPKKIKSFTVDEDVYNGLVEMFKKYKTGSASLYVNKKLEELLMGLRELEKGLADYSATVPMSYIIDDIMSREEKREQLLYPAGFDDEIKRREETNKERDEALEESHIQDEIGYWQIHYDAEQKGIPYELYKYMADGIFELSNDKRYLILKSTGEKFFPINGSLMKLVDEKK